MWGLIVLFAVVTCAQNADSLRAPSYVQSRTAFTTTRFYLQENVPRDLHDITNPEFQKHLAFGIIAGVTGNIALNASRIERWLNILDKTVPYVWENYDRIAATTNKLLSDANLKIQAITNIIDAICSTTDSVEQCNTMIHNKVTRSDSFVQNRAKLLLALGVVSDTINRHERDLNVAAADLTVVPYLLRTVKRPVYVKFIRDLASLYQLLRKYGGHY